MKADGHKVYISEYSMPEDFTCIWEKELKVQVACNSNSIPSVEKLFTL